MITLLLWIWGISAIVGVGMLIHSPPQLNIKENVSKSIKQIPGFLMGCVKMIPATLIIGGFIWSQYFIHSFFQAVR